MRNLFAFIEERNEEENSLISVEGAASWLADYRTHLILALDPDTRAVKGYISFTDCRDDESADVLLNVVEVNPDHHGSGIGRALVRSCTKWADSHGLPVSLLYSPVLDKLHGLRRFYESESFKLLATIPHAYDAGSNMCYMRREIK